MPSAEKTRLLLLSLAGGSSSPNPDASPGRAPGSRVSPSGLPSSFLSSNNDKSRRRRGAPGTPSRAEAERAPPSSSQLRPPRGVPHGASRLPQATRGSPPAPRPTPRRTRRRPAPRCTPGAGLLRPGPAGRPGPRDAPARAPCSSPVGRGGVHTREGRREPRSRSPAAPRGPAARRPPQWLHGAGAGCGRAGVRAAAGRAGGG